MYYIILIHYYITIIRIIFPIIFPIISQRTIISLYYITIISIIFTIISDYIRVLHPIFQELADTNCRPMHPEMTDKSPAASSQLLDDQASSPYEAMPTYSAKRRLLYALFRVLYLLFWMSVQDLAACYLDLCTAGRHTTNLREESCHHIKKKALLAITWAQFMPFSFVLFALYHYYLLLYALFQKSETGFGCEFIAEKLPISTSTTGDQWAYKPIASGTQPSSTKASSPTMSDAATGLADVCQPTCTQFRFELITQ